MPNPRHTPLLALLALVLTLALALTATMSASALPPVPPDPPDPPDDPVIIYDPPGGGFDWSVPDHFRSKAGGGYEHHWIEGATPAEARYATSYVRPASWPADFYACQTEADNEADLSGQSTPNRYVFTVAGQSPVSQNACRLRLQFPKEGTFDVKLQVFRPDNSVLGSWIEEVTINNLLIVQLGDSYGSGEGAVDRKRSVTGGEYGDWLDDRCHRSTYAASAQAARELERSNPLTSVTYLNFACSGATISREYYGADGDWWANTWDPFRGGDTNKPEGNGMLGWYRGAQPTNPDDYSSASHIPSQMDQLKAALSNGVAAQDIRHIDALMISAGGNDASFGPLAQACVVQDYCIDPNVRYQMPNGTTGTVKQRIDADLALLPARYDALEAALRATGIPIAQEYITEYPDPTTERRSDSGQIEQCEEALEDIMWALGMEIEGRQWVRGQVNWNAETELDYALAFLGRLNQQVAAAATRNGWQYVGNIASRFRGHGYCVGPNDAEDAQRFVQTFAMAAVYQGPGPREKGKGGLHPNYLGQQAIRDAILEKVSTPLAERGPDNGYVVRLPENIAPPGAPASASAAAMSPTTMAVDLGAASTGGAQITSWTAQCIDQATQAATSATSATRPVTVGGLTPQATYRCHGRATNSAGSGAWSPMSNAVTMPAPADTTAPTTTITSTVPTWTVAYNRSIAFTSNEPGSTFECSLDRRAYAACVSPLRITWKPGTRELRVRAIDPSGNRDATPARTQFTSPFDDRSLKRESTGWALNTGSPWYRSTATSSTKRLSSLTLGATPARGVALLATTCPTCGYVDVFRGTTLLKRVSLVTRKTYNKRFIPVITWDRLMPARGFRLQVRTTDRLVRIDGLGLITR